MNVQDDLFREKISPFLRKKLSALSDALGEDSSEYQGIARQYLYSSEEIQPCEEINNQHYIADVTQIEEDNLEHGVERLYRRSIVVEPIFACATHCRYCLRKNYKSKTLSERSLLNIAKFCGNDQNKGDLYEILITGGDPMIIPKRINYFVESLVQHAPNIKIIRIGTRLPMHDPTRIDHSVFSIFKEKSGIKFELALQVNHPKELFPETRAVIREFQALGVTIYAQNVLLKGVNDDLNTLITLYDTLRKLNVESHYLFHCIPMKNIHHFRTSIKRGLELTNGLTAGGKISGRAKPMFSIMTDIGKITLYEDTIIDRKDNGRNLLLKTHYSLEERHYWNPDWKLPESCILDENGRICVWYLDGEDD
ncbi:MAG: radical SAM protein [Desulfobacter sp.]